MKHLDCGLILVDWEIAVAYDPIVKKALDKLERNLPLEFPKEHYVVDVKVHMLMPGQFPCIPNWHCDFVPRDKEGKLQPERNSGEKMYLWLSNAPFTEFLSPDHQDSAFIGEDFWYPFDQDDTHRGTASEDFQWRMLIRVVPKCLVPLEKFKLSGPRRHSQVYLDSKDFNW